MVVIAEQIKSKLARKELNVESDEIKEIQSVMFNMGITGASDFSTQVSKDISGKNYHSELALELEKFLESVVDKFGGVIGLVDLYCMYNRARGTDLISPEDLNVACSKLSATSQKFMLKIYRSGVKTIQSSKSIFYFTYPQNFLMKILTTRKYLIYCLENKTDYLF